METEMVNEKKKELAKVINRYFGADAAYLDIDVFTLARRIMEAGWEKPVRCKDCKHWLHMEDGFGDCTNGRFHLDGHADPTMNADDFCSCGERRADSE